MSTAAGFEPAFPAALGVRLTREAGEHRVIVITSFVRSGSTALGEQLGTSDEAFYFGEIFHPEGYQHDANFFHFRDCLGLSGAPSAEMRHREWQEYDQHLRHLSGGRLPIIDIKYNSWHHLETAWHGPAESPFLLALLEQYSNPTFLHLRRRDVLLQVASEIIARHSGLWHARHEDEVGDVEIPATIEPEFVLSRMRESREQTAIVARWLRDKRTVDLLYEDAFAADGQLSPAAIEQLDGSGLGHVLSSLGRPPLKKLNRDPSRWIAGWREVVEAVAGSDFDQPLVPPRQR